MFWWRKHPPALVLGSFADANAEDWHFIGKTGADGGTRTRTPKRTTDFKSVASTIPPHPPVALSKADALAKVKASSPQRTGLTLPA